MALWMIKEFRGDKQTGFEAPMSGGEAQVRRILELLQARHLTNDEILDALGGATAHLTISPMRGSPSSGLMTSGTDYYYVATNEGDD
jgi:hypothetical protein